MVMIRARFYVVILPLLILSPGVRLGEERPDRDAQAHQASGTSPLKDPGARKVERVLEELVRNHASGNLVPRAYTVTEPEMNAFLAERLREEARKDVQALRVRFRDDSFASALTLDMDEVEMKGNPLTLELFRVLLSGQATLELEGRLVVENGKGTLILEATRINGTTVPVSIVSFILSALGKRQDPPFDPTDFFQMPYGIKVIKIEPGKATLLTGLTTDN